MHVCIIFMLLGTEHNFLLGQRVKLLSFFVQVLPAMDAAHLAMTQAAKLRPSPAVPGSMEAAVKMWLQVGNIQKLQQVKELRFITQRLLLCLVLSSRYSMVFNSFAVQYRQRFH